MSLLRKAPPTEAELDAHMRGAFLGPRPQLVEVRNDTLRCFVSRRGDSYVAACVDVGIEVTMRTYPEARQALKMSVQNALRTTWHEQKYTRLLGRWERVKLLVRYYWHRMLYRVTLACGQARTENAWEYIISGAK